MDRLEALIFAANLLYVATYFTQRLLRIRVMTLAASCCLLAYHLLRPDPILSIVGWNAFFIGLNVVQILRIRPPAVEDVPGQSPRSPQAAGLPSG